MHCNEVIQIVTRSFPKVDYVSVQRGQHITFDNEGKSVHESEHEDIPNPPEKFHGELAEEPDNHNTTSNSS